MCNLSNLDPEKHARFVVFCSILPGWYGNAVAGSILLEAADRIVSFPPSGHGRQHLARREALSHPLVSNAGRPFAALESPLAEWRNQMRRILDIAMDQDQASRERILTFTLPGKNYVVVRCGAGRRGDAQPFGPLGHGR
jgi:hypothetical protein